MGRAPCCDKATVKKGPWSPDEDAKLKAYIEQYGTGGNWIALPQKIGLKRCGKSCRLRWLNYLQPNIKHGGFSEEEESIIFSLYMSIGSRWSIIAAQLPGRTDNDIKNYWNTRLKRKLLGNKPRRAQSLRRSGGTKHDEHIKNEFDEFKVSHPEVMSNNYQAPYCPEMPVTSSSSSSEQSHNYTSNTDQSMATSNNFEYHNINAFYMQDQLVCCNSMDGLILENPSVSSTAIFGSSQLQPSIRYHTNELGISREEVYVDQRYAFDDELASLYRTAKGDLSSLVYPATMSDYDYSRWQNMLVGSSLEDNSSLFGFQ